MEAATVTEGPLSSKRERERERDKDKEPVPVSASAAWDGAAGSGSGASQSNLALKYVCDVTGWDGRGGLIACGCVAVVLFCTVITYTRTEFYELDMNVSNFFLLG